MFQRIRETVRVLSYKHEPLHPDLPWEAEATTAPTRASLVIGGAIQSLVIALAFGFFGVYLSEFIFPHQSAFSVGTLGAIGGVAALVGMWLVKGLENQVNAKLGNMLAPYFGFKLHETIRIMKGHSPATTSKSS